MRWERWEAGVGTSEVARGSQSSGPEATEIMSEPGLATRGRENKRRWLRRIHYRRSQSNKMYKVKYIVKIV